MNNKEQRNLTEDQKIELVVTGLVSELNRLCEELDCGYGEKLHEAIMRKFDDIGETEYRKWLGRIV